MIARAALALVAVVAPLLAATPAQADETTTITLKVRGCDACRVQPVQNVEGQLSYQGAKRKVRNGKVVLRVPTALTERMAFLVYAPYDELVQGGLVLAAVTRYRDKDVGDRVSPAYAGGAHKGSACWAGTSESEVRGTIVVGRRSQYDALFGSRVTVASAHFARTLDSLPYYLTVRGGSYHSSDPSICA